MTSPDLEERIEKASPQNKLAAVWGRIQRYYPKCKEWAKRYGPAETVGTATAYLAFFLTQEATDSQIAAAYAGTLGENVGFYGTMLTREVYRDRRAAQQEERSYGLQGVVASAGKLVTEFGLAETLDSLVVRPAAMGFGSRFFGRSLGVGIGKLAADFTFYIPPIASYELRNYFSRRNRTER